MYITWETSIGFLLIMRQVEKVNIVTRHHKECLFLLRLKMLLSFSHLLLAQILLSTMTGRLSAAVSFMDLRKEDHNCYPQGKHMWVCVWETSATS